MKKTGKLEGEERTTHACTCNSDSSVMEFRGMHTGSIGGMKQGSAVQDTEMSFYETKQKFGEPKLLSSQHKMTMEPLMMGNP